MHNDSVRSQQTMKNPMGRSDLTIKAVINAPHRSLQIFFLQSVIKYHQNFLHIILEFLIFIDRFLSISNSVLIFLQLLANIYFYFSFLLKKNFSLTKNLSVNFVIFNV